MKFNETAPSKKQFVTSESSAPFNHSMRRDWAKGKLSAKSVLEYCQNASKQGAHGLERVENLSKANNQHRDILRAMGWPEAAPEIEWLSIPGFHAPHPVLSPICTFEKLIQGDEQRFLKKLRGEDPLRNFWENVADHVIYTASAHLIDNDFSIPLGLHGDGAATTKTDGLLTFAWGSLVATGSDTSTIVVSLWPLPGVLETRQKQVPCPQLSLQCR